MQKQFSFYQNYELLDCGDLRRLERFGDIVIDRPAKQADFAKKLSKNTWDKADAVFVGDWSFNKKLPESFVLDLGPAKMELKFKEERIYIGLHAFLLIPFIWILKKLALFTGLGISNNFFILLVAIVVALAYFYSSKYSLKYLNKLGSS